MDRAKAILGFLIILTAVSIFIYFQFSSQREVRANELKGIEFSFETAKINGVEVVDLDLRRYTDITYLGLSINAKNNRGFSTLRAPVIRLYLEGVLIQEKDLGDIALPGEATTTIDLNDLTFNSEIINSVLEGKTDRPDQTLNFSAVLTFEYSFTIQGIRLATYSLSETIEGRVPLRTVFGGKTQEEAVDVILGLNRSEEKG